MKCKSIVLLALYLAISVQYAYAQLPKSKYVIFTFECTNNKSPHGTQIYYWIQSVDSVNQFQTHLNKFILSGYSVSELQDCCMGKPINPYTSRSVNTDSYNFTQTYYMVLDTVEGIINAHRRRIQVIHKGDRQKMSETIRVYVTPIEGIVCISKFIPLRDREMLYKGSICIPYANFSFYQGFWKIKEYKSITKLDYSKIAYSILPPNQGK